MRLEERFRGCILCGAIGDAYGSAFENMHKPEETVTHYWGAPPEKSRTNWQITDDTQLTLATCETIIDGNALNPDAYAQKYLQYFKQNKLPGIGSSTLKALKDLEYAGHWSLVGRKGEFAAGNGAAMRIAPTAFVSDIDRSLIRDISSITHNNDEAYVGALCVHLSIRATINNTWTGKENLIELLIDQIPDTRVRDRLIDIKGINDLLEIGQLGNDGYVVNSVPLAMAAANMAYQLGIETMFEQIIEIGGDTDTNASIAGQIVGALVGTEGIPKMLLMQLSKLYEYKWIESIINRFVLAQNWD